MSKSYIIKLERKDVVKQIASYYVQTIFGWNPPKDAYCIMLKKHFMELCIKDVIKSNQIVRKLNFFDEQVFFEDIVAGYKSTELKSTYAKNYSDLLQAIFRVWRVIQIDVLNESMSSDSLLNKKTLEFIDGVGNIRIEEKKGTIT